MKHPKAEDLLSDILKRDSRYTLEAYFFVREALEYTVKQFDAVRHVSGQELLEGIREYTLREFGPMSKRVLNEWGMEECVDFGHVVFNLIEGGLLGKTKEDRIEDFYGGYHFDDAFLQPFRPAGVECSGKGTVSVD